MPAAPIHAYFLQSVHEARKREAPHIRESLPQLLQHCLYEKPAYRGSAITSRAASDNLVLPPSPADVLRATQHHHRREKHQHIWDVSENSPITEASFAPASAQAIADLDQSFFLVRFDRLTPSEKRYLRAMAELGAGPHRAGDIAQVMGREVTSLAPTPAQLIHKGMVWSPSHGDTAFTVPMFDEFMKMTVPAEGY